MPSLPFGGFSISIPGFPRSETPPLHMQVKGFHYRMVDTTLLRISGQLFVLPQETLLGLWGLDSPFPGP